jgi:hypothetical protein
VKIIMGRNKLCMTQKSENNKSTKRKDLDKMEKNRISTERESINRW